MNEDLLDIVMSKYNFRFLVAFFLFISPSAIAADAANSSFSTQCPLLLAQADDFAKECLTKARSQTRIWHPAGTGLNGGEPETHSVWFGEAAPGSHFGLICTLNQDHQLDYLGIAYSTNGENFKTANEAPIQYIDFNGNAGVLIGSKTVNFKIVRQLSTKKFPTHFKEAVKNCENPIQPNGEIKDVHGGGWIFQTHDNGKLILKTCSAPSACESHEYYDFFNQGDKGIIFTNEWGAYFWLIQADGGLLVRKETYDSLCRIPPEKRVGSEQIVFEVCDES